MLAVKVNLPWYDSSSEAAEVGSTAIKIWTVYSPRGTIKPSSIKSSPAAPTMLPSTFPVSQSPKLKNIFLPVIQKQGDPYSFKARLPLLANTSPAPEIPYKEKTILVDISEQHVYAYEKGELIFSFAASTGRKNLTRPGSYRILDKIPNAYSDPWGFWMPFWMGIYYAGYNLENGFHSLPVLSNGTKLWGDKIGTPVTYGCVVLLPGDMKKLYRWARVGTAVVIQK